MSAPETWKEQNMLLEALMYQVPSMHYRVEKKGKAYHVWGAWRQIIKKDSDLIKLVLMVARLDLFPEHLDTEDLEYLDELERDTPCVRSWLLEKGIEMDNATIFGVDLS